MLVTGNVVFNDHNQPVYPDTCMPLKTASLNREIELIAIGRGDYPGGHLKPEDLNGVRSIGFWDAKREQTFGLPPHQNEGIEFTLCEAGELSFSCENRTTKLCANMMAITRPWQIHKLGDPNIEICRLHWMILDVGVRHPHQVWTWPEWIILNPEDLNYLTKILRENEAPVWQGKVETIEIFKKITAQIKNYGQPGVSSSLKLLINELLLNIYLTLKAQKPSLDTGLVTTERSVKLFLSELPRMLQREWTSQDMADYCHLKSTRFIYYCKKITNMSPIQYLQFLRIQKAKTLLKEDRLNITDVAFNCGFSSSQYFNRIFKRYTDLSPQEYRKKKL